MEFYVECEYEANCHSGKIHFLTKNNSIKAILLELKGIIFRKFKDIDFVKITSFKIEFDDWKNYTDKNECSYENLLDFINEQI